MGAKLPEKCSLGAFQDKKMPILKVKIVKIYILIGLFQVFSM